MALSFSDPVSRLPSRFSGTFGMVVHDPSHNHASSGTFRRTSNLGMQDRVYMTRVGYSSTSSRQKVRLIEPVLVTRVWFSSSDNAWFATDDLTEEFGVADSWFGAIENYVDNLHTMAHWFEENQTPLGPMMEKRLRTFRRLFRGL